MSTYPKYNDKKFNRKVYGIFKKHKSSNIHKTFKEVCYPKEFNLQPQQLFMPSFIAPNTPYRNILLFHGIGSGKTCTAIRICEKWKNRKKIIVVLPSSLINNFKDEIISQCTNNEYVTPDQHKQLKNGNLNKHVINTIYDKINKYYTIYSYNKFTQLISNRKINLKNTLLVIDEIQNMVSEHGSYYKLLYNLIKKNTSGLITVLLSATPMFDKPSEISLIINLLNPKINMPIGTDFNNTFISSKLINGKYKYNINNEKMFRDMIRGFISHYNGAPKFTYPKKNLKYVHCYMSDYQYKYYEKVNIINADSENNGMLYSNRIFKNGDYIDIPNNFYIGARIVSNIVFPGIGIGDKGFKTMFRGKSNLSKLGKFSSKFYKLLKYVKSSNGTVFIYSNFTQYGGLKTIATLLECIGYKNFAKHGIGKKRYAIWSGDESNTYKNRIKTVFNDILNLKGNMLKIILGSLAIKEGVTLLRVRDVHIMEPYWNFSRIDQIVGRAVRFCSHKELLQKERYVNVYIYIAKTPKYIKRQTIDEYVHEIACSKNNLIKSFEKILKEESIDCRLNNKDTHIKCK
jgi:hypothetical protein